jgi:hypothetical protein
MIRNDSVIGALKEKSGTVPIKGYWATTDVREGNAWARVPGALQAKRGIHCCDELPELKDAAAQPGCETIGIGTKIRGQNAGHMRQVSTKCETPCKQLVLKRPESQHCGFGYIAGPPGFFIVHSGND